MGIRTMSDKIILKVKRPFQSNDPSDPTEKRPPAEVNVTDWDKDYVKGLKHAGFLVNPDDDSEYTDGIEENDIIGEKLGEKVTSAEEDEGTDDSTDEGTDDETDETNEDSSEEPNEETESADSNESESTTFTQEEVIAQAKSVADLKDFIEEAGETKPLKAIIDKFDLKVKKNLSLDNMKKGILGA